MVVLGLVKGMNGYLDGGKGVGMKRAEQFLGVSLVSENDAFCILSFKSMNRVCYRFIHSPYRREDYPAGGNTGKGTGRTNGHGERLSSCCNRKIGAGFC